MKIYLSLALRSAWRNRTPAVMVVVTLSAAVAFLTLVATLADAVFVRPAQLRFPHDTVYVSGLGHPPDVDAVRWWSPSRSIRDLVYYVTCSASLDQSDEPARIAVVSEGFFRALGARLEMGRTWNEGESNQLLAVISHSLWQRRWASAPSAVGSPLLLNQKRFTVIGIIEDGQRFPGATEIWIPRREHQVSADEFDPSLVRFSPLGWPEGWIGRLASGASVRSANAEMRTLLTRLNERFSHKNVRFGDVLTVRLLSDSFGLDLRGPLLILLIGAIFLAIAATCNAASIMATWGRRECREYSIQYFLGAGFAVVAWQVFSRALILFLLIAILGATLSSAGLSLLTSTFPQYLAFVIERDVDMHITGTVLCVSIVLLTCAIAPMMYVALRKSEPTLSGIVRTEHAGLVSKALVATQLMITMVLLVGSTVFTVTAYKWRNAPLGYSVDNLFGTVTTKLDEPQVKSLTARFEALAGNTPCGAPMALVSAPPFESASIPRLWSRQPGDPISIAAHAVNPSYFSTVGVQIVAGRAVSMGSMSVVVSKSLADFLWPKTDPLGKGIMIEGEESERTVVGVARDTRPVDDVKTDGRQVYFSIDRTYRGIAPSTVHILYRRPSSCKLSPNEMRTQLATALQTKVSVVRSLETVRDQGGAATGLRAALSLAYAALAVLMALSAIYAMASSDCAARTVEVGVRGALGATPKDIVSLFALESLTVSSVGGIAGTVLSIWLLSATKGLLHGVSEIEGATLVLSASLVVLAPVCISVVCALKIARRMPTDLLAARHSTNAIQRL